jgi:hypothetical protein
MIMAGPPKRSVMGESCRTQNVSRDERSYKWKKDPASECGG